MKKRLKNLVACLALALTGALLLFSITILGEVGDQQLVADSASMDRLAKVARDMIAEGGPCVRGTGESRHITSFSAFFSYVARQYPRAVSKLEDPNPFPGFLPNTSYDRTGTTLEKGEDVLLSSKPFIRFEVDITHLVHADGSVEVSIKHQGALSICKQFKECVPILALLSVCGLIYCLKSRQSKSDARG